MIILTSDDRSKPISIPRNVAICPICSADIRIEYIHEWECKNGMPVDITIDCVTEPDIASDEWEDWHCGHWSMPYVDWLPVEQRVLKWFQREYRCEVTD